ncbi:MAG: translation initiation factor IF-6 [Nitrososphaerales archaeon]
MTIHLLDIYRTSNIGIFLKSNERFLLVPRGLATTKIAKLSEYLDAEPVETSIGGSRLLGPLIAMNGKGMLVSRLAEEAEIRHLKESTGLPVERVPARYTSIGNLISANDKGVVASQLLQGVKDLIVDVLDAPVEFLTIAAYHQVGSMMVSSNAGSAVHPQASDEEVSKAAGVLKVDVEPATVNGGVPFVASGVVITQEKAVVGSLTSGPELIMLSRVFRL